ncbi:MAG TPA: hypothetical protein DIS90_02235, partial [Cytophagales bacterium]|nr:hypothetical protein [Cytophagales bacterium]
MALKNCIIFSLALVVFNSCNNLEDVDLTERSTFIHFYEKSVNYKGVTAEQLADGYILAGNLENEVEFSSVITRTDLFGNVVWEKIIPNSSVSAIKVIADGYLILGDSIQVDTEAAQVLDVITTKSRLIKMNLDGDILVENNFYNKNNLKVDFHGDALNLDASGNIITVGNFQDPASTAKTFVAAHDPTTLDTIWTQKYSLIDRDYKNSKSTYVAPSGKIIWASSAEKSVQNNFRSYIAVPSVDPNSTFVSSDFFGVVGRA